MNALDVSPKLSFDIECMYHTYMCNVHCTSYICYALIVKRHNNN